MKTEKTLNLNKKDLIKQASDANKEIMKYYKENRLKPLKDYSKHPVHSQFLQPRLEIIRLSRHMVRNDKYQEYEQSIKVHHMKTRREMSKSRLCQLNKEMQNKRESKEVIELPEEIKILEAHRIKKYIQVFNLNYNSGMPKEKAQKIALRYIKKQGWYKRFKKVMGAPLHI